MGKRHYKQTEQQFLQHVGERVHHYRIEKRRLTQEQLAEKIDSDSTYISKVENGQAKGLTVPMLKTIADALDVPIADLIDIGNKAGSLQSEKRITRLLTKTMTLNSRERTIVSDTVEAMLDSLTKPPSHSL